MPAFFMEWRSAYSKQVLKNKYENWIFQLLRNISQIKSLNKSKRKIC